ncbi:MAG: PqqD family protein [Terrisporobacter sp.]|uniref:PqqD family protein n=1 Tax=Terrisporobacter sp. TaxID=1965305 RepID=UPI0039A0D90C
MNLNKDFILRNIAGESILVATGSATQDFNGMITLNEVATFILENIDECEREEVLVGKVLEEFEVDEETARSDVREFLDQAIKFGIILK